MISVGRLVACVGTADWSDETLIMEVSDEMQRAIERAREQVRSVTRIAARPVVPARSHSELLTSAPAQDQRRA